MDPVVDVGWLVEHLADPDLVVLDCSVVIEMTSAGMTTISGRADYDAQHIPGAGFADLVVELSDTTQSIGFAVPSPGAFCEAMGSLGVGDDTRVVLYDASMSMWAARVWWMLRWVGFDRASVLDGGLTAWLHAGHAMSTDPSTQPNRTLIPAVRPELIADRHEVLAATEASGVLLVDTLPEAHYRGEMALYERPGHIPGAVSVPVFDLLDDAGRLQTIDHVAASHGGDTAGRTITYCGGGIAASLSALALTRAGYTDVAVYTASLQEWASDPNLPLVTG